MKGMTLKCDLNSFRMDFDETYVVLGVVEQPMRCKSHVIILHCRSLFKFRFSSICISKLLRW